MKIKDYVFKAKDDDELHIFKHGLVVVSRVEVDIDKEARTITITGREAVVDGTVKAIFEEAGDALSRDSE